MWLRNKIHLFLLSVTGLLLASSVSAGELQGQVHWSGQVTIKEATVVMPQAVLTVAPGTRIKVTTAGAKLSVRGRILIEGTEKAPVRFDSPKDWAGIEFMEAAKGSRLAGLEIRDAKAAVSSFATDFEVRGSTFRNCEAGVKLLRESAPLIVDSLFENNQMGVVNEMKSAAVIRGNRFLGQTKTAILASHGSKGAIRDNHFEKNKQAIALLQKFQDRIANNRFVANETGIYCNQTQSTPLIEQNHFEKNKYALVNFSFAYPVVKNNTFIDNEMAVRNDQYGSPLLENNLFRGNETALYNYRKSNPRVLNNQFEQNQLAIFCDFSAYPEVKQNNFVNNVMGVKLGIYQSADWEKRSGSKAIMQREALARKSQNPLLAKAPTEFRDAVDVSENWWGEQNDLLAAAGKDGNVSIFHDRRDQPKVTYEGYGPESYRLDRVHFTPWLESPVSGTGPKVSP